MTGMLRSTSLLFILMLLGCSSDKPQPRAINERTNLLEHQFWVSALALSPDGEKLVSGARDLTPAQDATLRVWEVGTARLLCSRTSHTRHVQSIAFSPDGKYYATAGGNKEAFLWDAATDNFVRAFKGHTERIEAVDFSPDSKTLLTGSWDGTARLWDISTGDQQAIFKDHGDKVYCARFSPDGKAIAVGSGSAKDTDGRATQGELTLWNVADQKLIFQKNGHQSWISALAFQPNGKYIATNSYFARDRVMLWNLDTTKPETVLKADTSKTWSLCFSSKGSYLIVGGLDTNIHLIDMSTGLETLKLTGHANAVTCIAISNNGRILVSGGESAGKKGIIKIWDLPRAFQ